MHCNPSLLTPQHIEELLPIMTQPTIGQYCQGYSLMFRRWVGASLMFRSCRSCGCRCCHLPLLPLPPLLLLLLQLL